MKEATSPLSPVTTTATATGASTTATATTSTVTIMSSNEKSHHHLHPGNNHSSWFERQSGPLQFCLLAGGVFLFFGIHNYLQEAIMSVPGFQYGVMLGYFEVLGVTVCSFIERQVVHGENNNHNNKRIAPLSAYPFLTLCLMSSSSLSNLALNYINFPTKVVFRSCKLIPTMVVASIVHKKVFTSVEYFCSLCVCMGLVMFAAADWNLKPSFHPIGLAFVSLSVCADAVLPNAQERLFKLGSSRLEVTFFTNIFTLIAMTITTLLSGDLLGMIAFALNNNNTLLCHYVAVYTFVSYIAISVHMNVVRRFGGVVAVLLATGRKGMTLVLSFVLFPKAFSWYYVMGAILVLGGLLLSSLVKIHSQKKKQQHNNTIIMSHHHSPQQKEQQPASSSSSSPPRSHNEEMELLLVTNNKDDPGRSFDIEQNGHYPHFDNHDDTTTSTTTTTTTPRTEPTKSSISRREETIHPTRSTAGGGFFGSRIHPHEQ